jgi:hypothetical protein
MRASFNVAAVAAALKTLVAAASSLAIGLAALRGGGTRAPRVKTPTDVPLFAVEPVAVKSRGSGDQTT